MFVLFFRRDTAYVYSACLWGTEMCIGDSSGPFVRDYACNRYEAICRDWSDFTDRVCRNLSPERQRACLEIFRACSLHELHFWEMSAKPRTDL